jgi:hypothetical protein
MCGWRSKLNEAALFIEDQQPRNESWLISYQKYLQGKKLWKGSALELVGCERETEIQISSKLKPGQEDEQITFVH